MFHKVLSGENIISFCRCPVVLLLCIITKYVDVINLNPIMRHSQKHTVDAMFGLH